jgi:hypothetical protein
VNIGEISATAVTTLIAVILGGWLTIWGQDRLWRRDHQRQWRDIRLAAYTSYLTAFREYIAYVLRPTTRVSTVQRPRKPYDPMPFFEDQGSVYKERLDAAKTALRLVSGRPDVVQASNEMVRQARLLAADRATHDIDALAPERFERLWSSEREFVLAAREELGLASDFEIGDRPLRGRDSERDGASKSPFAAWVQDPE